MTNTRDVFAESAEYFPTPLQQQVFFDKYSRFDYTHMRREAWVETVERAVSFLRELSLNKLDESVYTRIHQSILNMQAMPSMRVLAMAGESARRNHIGTYNCSFSGVDSLDTFVEALIISMSGCGVGFSVESQYVSQLPRIQPQRGNGAAYTHVVGDSAEGWADALRIGLDHWVNGDDLSFDLSLVRPAGAILKVKGGRASGEIPLRNLLTFARQTIINAAGRQLTSLECHDLMCEVGNAAVQGGVRRSAMISLFDRDDSTLTYSKHGNFAERRWNANNSAVIDRLLTRDEFADLMYAMHESGRGEPGLFSRLATDYTKPARRKDTTFGTNPLTNLAA